MAARNFLEVDTAPKSILNVIEEPDFGDFDADLQVNDFKSITPIPGICIKTRTDNNEKMFINLCHSIDIPPPPPLLDEQITSKGENEDVDESILRFPLSLGDPHYEYDKSGKRCICYDVVINSGYFQEVQQKPKIRDFIMTLACSGLERKHNISIDVGACILLINKRYHGEMPTHYIRLKSASNSDFSLKKELPPPENEDGDNSIVMPVNNPSRLVILPEIVRYQLFKVPAEKDPTFLVFQGLTKGIANKKSIRVFVSQSALTVRTAESKILLKIALPFDVIPEMSLSNFYNNRLIVCMNVESSELD